MLCDIAGSAVPLSLQEQWVWGRSESEARDRAAAELGVDPNAVVLIRGDRIDFPQSLKPQCSGRFLVKNYPILPGLDESLFLKGAVV